MSIMPMPMLLLVLVLVCACVTRVFHAAAEQPAGFSATPSAQGLRGEKAGEYHGKCATLSGDGGRGWISAHGMTL